MKSILLKTSALIHRGRDRFCQVSRPVPCPHVRCERLAWQASRTGNLFCVCSLVQNNTFPLSCFFCFMVHLHFSCIKYRFKAGIHATGKHPARNLKMVAGVGFEPTRFRTEVWALRACLLHHPAPGYLIGAPGWTWTTRAVSAPDLQSGPLPVTVYRRTKKGHSLCKQCPFCPIKKRASAISADTLYYSIFFK